MALEFEIVKLNNFSGNQASVYTIRLLKENYTIFENFVLENKSEFKSEIIDTINR